MPTTFTPQRPDEMRDALLSIHEALEIVGGKWKIQILLNLVCGDKRFMEIKGSIEGLSNKVLSKELRELELHNLIKKEVDVKSNRVRYKLIDYNCQAIEKIIDGLRQWGDYHRSKIFQRTIHTRSIVSYVKKNRKKAIPSALN